MATYPMLKDNDMPKPSKVMASIKDTERWRVEEDLRICVECDKIESDPKRYAKVKELAKEKMLSVASIASESED